MKIYVLFLDGEPRLDITALDVADIGPRAAKALTPGRWMYLQQENRVEIKRIRLQVLA